MSTRAKRTFRPEAESIEGRCLAAAQLMTAGVGIHALEAHPHAARAAIQATRHPAHPVRPGGQNLGGPNGGLGLIRLGLPGNFLDYGVVTLWNNTRTTVSFSVSASTYHNGQYYPFTFRPGQVQSFYAPVVNGGVPLFQVRFNTNPYNPIALPNSNIVFESPGYRPSGTAGWPYAIGLNANRYYLTGI